MPLANGCNHVTVVTHDIDRFKEFYQHIFDAEVRFDQTDGTMRHAMIDVGGGFYLHPFQVPGDNLHRDGLNEIFARGHIDHFALDFSEPEAFETARRRLVAAGATNGRVRDFGAIKILAFRDPDGMEAEIALWSDGPLLTMPESRVEAFVPA